MFYPAHEAFVAPARVYPQIWRLIAGLVLAFVIFAIVSLAVMFGAVFLDGGPELLTDASDWLATDPAQREGPFPVQTAFAALVEGQTPTDTLILLATFIGLFLAAIAVARLLHRRRLGTLTGPFVTLWQHGLIAIAIAVVVLGVTSLFLPEIAIEPNLDWSLWLSFLPLALVLILIQTGAEELLFRGYIQQQLAARFRSPLVWMVLPSLLFALGHYDPATMGSQAWLVVAATGIFGLAAADLTAHTGSIGAAWGFHFANNVIAILFTSIEGPLGGLSLYTVPATALAPDLLSSLLMRDMAITVLIWLAIRLALRRRRARGT